METATIRRVCAFAGTNQASWQLHIRIETEHRQNIDQLSLFHTEAPGMCSGTGGHLLSGEQIHAPWHVATMRSSASGRSLALGKNPERFGPARDNMLPHPVRSATAQIDDELPITTMRVFNRDLKSYHRLRANAAVRFYHMCDRRSPHGIIAACFTPADDASSTEDDTGEVAHYQADAGCLRVPVSGYRTEIPITLIPASVTQTNLDQCRSFCNLTSAF